MSQNLGSRRWDYWQSRGRSAVRTDGSVNTLENEIESAEAEEFACRALALPYMDTLLDGADAGADTFADLWWSGRLIPHVGIQIRWMGRWKQTGEPKTPENGGGLWVKHDKPHRFAPLYLSVCGGMFDHEGFMLAGWMTHSELTKMPTRNVGFGDDFFCPGKQLLRVDILRYMIEEGRFHGAK